MQFTVVNNCPYPLGVFASDRQYSPKEFARMIKPAEVLKKAIYEYYWYNKKNEEWVDVIDKNSSPYLRYYGLAVDDIEVYNLNRVLQYLYVFFTKIIDKKITLWYYQIPIKEYFNQYDTMAVYQYTVKVNDGDGTPTISSDPSLGTLLVDYYGEPLKVQSEQVDWIPTMEMQQTHSTWQTPLIILALVAVIIVAIVLVFAVTIKQPNSVSKYISNHVENIQTTQPEYLG